MQRTSVDGVPVFLADGPPPFSAGLVFGVGRRDEDFVRGGITHLVEHLAMSAVGRTVIDSNASVDLTTTEFTATGSPERVAEFLRAVCGALADLPTGRLGIEADVLRAEGGSAVPPAFAVLLGELYGIAGPGLAAADEPAMRSITADQVQDWAARWFRRSNAALWVSGPLPDGLTLPLPDGPRPVRAPAAPRSLVTPAWAGAPFEDRIALGARLPDRPGVTAMLGVLRHRVEDELRHRRGIAYAVETGRLPVAADEDVVLVTSDVRPDQVDVAATVLWRELLRLADQGPGPHEVEEQRALVASALDDPRAPVDEARSLAACEVTGVPATASAELRATMAALTTDDVRVAAAVLRDGAVLLLPAEADAAPAGLTRLPEWSADVVPGRVFGRRRLRGVPKDARLVVGDEGVSLVLDDERRVTVRWPDVVGMVRQAPDEWLVVGRDGLSLPLAAADWKDGAEALATARAAVPEHLQVTQDAVEGDGLLLVRAPEHRVREALAMGTYGATLLTNGEWTAVLADGDRTAQDVAGDIAPVVGRDTASLVLRRRHADVGYVLLRGGTEVGRHTWGVTVGDPALLAGATGRPLAFTQYLLRVTGTPEEVLAHAVQALGLPREVPGLVDGSTTPPPSGRVEARGLVGGFRASVRGDFAPPAGTGGFFEEWLRLSRTPPPWYLALNVLGAVLSAAGLWVAVALDDLPTVWRVVVGTMCGIGLVNCLWDLRPRRRRRPAGGAVDQGPAPVG